MLTNRWKTVQQVGLPYHWGYSGLVKGDIGNDLVAISEESNVRIMETKGLLCNVLRGKRAANSKVITSLHSTWRTHHEPDRFSHRRLHLHRLQGL